MYRTRISIGLGIALLALLCTSTHSLQESSLLEAGVPFVFDTPITGISFRTNGTVDAKVRGFDGEQWSAWKELEIETEFDPLLRETNLVLFPTDVQQIEVSGDVTGLIPHPVRVSKAPVQYQVAARIPVTRPRILKRRQWGADESFLVRGPKITRSDLPSTSTSRSEEPSIAASPIEKRVVDCAQLQRDFPNEFRTVGTVRKNARGEALRWPQSYSPKIHALVVHHTAINVEKDSRPPAERVRALYTYHANNREWGDIGYNYVIDELGQIYEGRAGGDKVVAGHAYCHNVGTLGVALLGNFEQEKPTKEQIASLQWLLDDLATEHKVNLNRKTRFHGRTIDPITGHGELVSTVCPGYYMRSVIDQIYANVRNGKLNGTVTFPSFRSRYKNRTNDRLQQRKRSLSTASRSIAQETLAVRGDAKLRGRPGSQQLVSLHYQAGGSSKKRGTTIGSITRSDKELGVWLEQDGQFERLRNRLDLPVPLPARGTLQLTLKVQFPKTRGTSTVKIGSVVLKLETQGRQLRNTEGITKHVPTVTTPTTPRVRPTPRRTTSRLRHPTTRSTRRTIRSRNTNRTVRPSRRAPRNTKVRAQSRRPQTLSSDDGPPIRIRLTIDGSPTIRLENGGQIGSVSVGRNFETTLRAFGSKCGGPLGSSAQSRQTDVEANILSIKSSDSSPITVTSAIGTRHYLGSIECRIIDGELALINELPLEDYMRGLAEEPDTEPFEKQRAFAVAARSYATSYMGAVRKFPGMPYDGNDSPAFFQKYTGVTFANSNPRWVEAVDSTHLQVLQVDRKPIRAAYYSSNDGRTRSPAEVGWPGFPNADVFSSKPDPWCKGLEMRGHGVGMSGCGGKGQAEEGKSAEEILQYYYPGTALLKLRF